MMRMESHQALTVAPPIAAKRKRLLSASLIIGRAEARAMMTMTNMGSV